MTVSTPYNYVNGLTLDTLGHNQNIYTPDNGVGIMSEANGGIGTTNLHSTFQVSDEHVWPREVCRGQQEFLVDTVDYFSDAFSDISENSSAFSAGDFRPIIGGSVRIYVPYDVSLALWEWSFFFSPFKIFTEADMAALRSRNFDMSIKARLDGSALQHTQRAIPQSVLLGISGSSGNRKVEDRPATAATETFETTRREPAVSMQWDMNHMETNVSAGWHSLDLMIYMSPVIDRSLDENEGILIAKVKRKVGQKSATFNHKFYQRLTFGIRNARVLTIL